MSKPLFLLFKQSLDNECFSNEWKKTNIVLAQKKAISSLFKIIDPYNYYLYAGKSLIN